MRHAAPTRKQPHTRHENGTIGPPLTQAQIAATLSAEQWIYLAVGPNVWGRGFSQDQARDAMKASAGRTRTAHVRHLMYACADPWARISELGDIEYTPRTRHDGPPTEHAREYVEVYRQE